MSSLFDNARGLLRASIADCFGSKQYVIAEDGSPLEVIGYVKKSQRDDHIIQRLLTPQDLPENCVIHYQGKTYALVYDKPLTRANDTSQITNEYTLVIQAEGSSNGWSEFNP